MMVVVAPPTAWTTDLTRLCERLAERLAAEGARYPEAGAVALAVRGRAGVDRPTFADDLGLDPDELRRVERGEVPFDEFPAAIRQRAHREPRLDLRRLGVWPPA
jgi:hypothetical protein